MNHEARIDRLRRSLQPRGLDAFFVDSPIDLFYLTGMNLSAGSLVVTKASRELFVDGRYLEVCKARSPLPVFLVSDESLRAAMQGALVGFDSTQATFAQGELLSKLATVQPMPRFLQMLRSVKEAEEITALREAAALACKGLDFVVSQLQEGVSELQLARTLEIYWLQQGGERLSFDPIVAFGPNAALPHHRSGESQLAQDSLVLIDLGVQWRHYQSDMTRVHFFGAVSAELREIYTVVRKSLEAALGYCRSGITAGELDHVARKEIEGAGFGDFFPHSLGHGVGLETHEWPVLRQNAPFGETILEAGMVLTLEPGIYLPGLGGVRLEETVLVTESGAEVLTSRPL